MGMARMPIRTHLHDSMQMQINMDTSLWTDPTSSDALALMQAVINLDLS